MRVVFGGNELTKTVTVRPNMNSRVRLGFVFGIDENTRGSVQSLIAPERPLPMYRLATGDRGLGRSLRWRRVPQDERDIEEPRPRYAEHYGSGYRFPANQEVDRRGRYAWQPDGRRAVYVAACASDDSVQLGLPLYVQAESAAAAGFVVRGVDGSLALIPATETTYRVVQQSLDAGGEHVGLAAGPPDPETAVSVGTLTWLPAIAEPFDRQAPQYARVLPYSTYDWEVFFHAPMMIAQGLATQQRYGEALRWLHTIFDPTATDGSGQPQWWRFQPFAAAGQGVGIDLLLEDFSADRLDAEQLGGHPGATGLLAHVPVPAARYRPDADPRLPVDGGAQVPRRAHRLGRPAVPPRHHRVDQRGHPAVPARRRAARPPPDPAAATPAAAGTPDVRRPGRPLGRLLERLGVTRRHPVLQGSCSPGSRTWRSTGWVPAAPRSTSQWSSSSSVLSMQSLAFCVPRNDRLDHYWDLVEDRLFKIRSSQNIDGVHRRLALFEPPIDPALLVRAVAAGLDISSVLNETFAPPTPYRFSLALQLAEEFCAEVKALGATLLSALEKRDAEDLARLRSTQELALLNLVGDFKRRQLDEAEANLTALRQSRETAEVRYRHYQRLLGKDQIQTPPPNDPVEQETPRLQLASSTSDKVDADLRGYGLTLEEADHLGWLTVGNTYTLIGGAFHIASGHRQHGAQHHDQVQRRRLEHWRQLSAVRT